MGKASRLKRRRRKPAGLQWPRNLPAPFRGARLRINRDRPKISEALLDLVQPLIQDDADLEEFRSVLGVGAIAWNLSLIEEDSPVDARELMEGLATSDREELDRILSQLVARKRGLFPEDRRFVAGWDVTVQPDGNYFVTAVAVGGE